MELKFSKAYFETAQERYLIRLRRKNGEFPPWTEDPVFREWRFCNVHREHDKTTAWLRNHVRIPLNRDRDQLIEAVVIFRWFNRIETGNRLLDLLLYGWDSVEAQRRLQGIRPIVTGAYMIRTPEGLDKLTGVLQCIDNIRKILPHMTPHWGSSLRDAWADLKAVDYLGPFLAYEIVTDLRWTPVLHDATDINTWTNAGPGCTRGVGRILSGNPLQFRRQSPKDQDTMLRVLQHLFELSRDPKHWPLNWKPWELRECEHWACEFDKYQRATAGERLKQRFRN